MKTRAFLFALGGLVLLFFIMGVRMVPPATPENCKEVQGVVERIYTPCCLDVHIKLKDDDRNYYINRGLENQTIDLNKLQAQLLHQEVNLQVIKTRWSPMNPTHNLAPIAAIEIDEKTVFSRLQ